MLAKKLSVDLRRAVVGLAVCFCLARTSHAQHPASPPVSRTDYDALNLELSSLDPHSENGLRRIKQLADYLTAATPKKSKTEKKHERQDDALKDLSAAELIKHFSDSWAKYDPRAAGTIGRLVSELSQTHDPEVRQQRFTDILEVQSSIREARKPAVPQSLGVVTSWVFFFQNMSGGIAHGKTPATDLVAPATSGGDHGRIDPKPSTFWKRPSTIPKEDLYAGFSRAHFPRFDNALYSYSAPKVSSGTHAGFEVELNSQRYKIKFGEVNSEPFTARIFHALGYNVDPTDYTPQIRVKYSRRMLREFHLRKPLEMRIAPLGVPLWTVQLQTHYDPFAFIATAVFKDGREVSGTALKQILFKCPAMGHPEDLPDNFRPEVEATLDYLVTVPANVQPRDTPTQSIGSWEFDGLDHENRRELRGAGLLAAWLAYFDSRPDNTKLRIQRDTDEVQLEHFISDLGGGMGQGTGWFSPHGENPNDFTWTFTEAPIVRGRGRMTTPFRITHFKPVVPTLAFDAMTIDDARWMARLIGQLTESQLREALIASGYDNAGARLYIEKLTSRRDRMIQDLGLENEISLLRPQGQPHQFSYIPAIDSPFEMARSDSIIQARASSAVIVNGKLQLESKSLGAQFHDPRVLLLGNRRN
jgi:hypothetical protein